MGSTPSATPHALGRATLVAACLLLLSSSGSCSSNSAQEAALNHTLAGEPCGEALTASITPGAEVSQGTGIERYEMTLAGTNLDIDLLDRAGASLGLFQLGLEIDVDLDTGALEEWRVQTQLVEDGSQPLASQNLRGRVLSERRLWLEIEHRVGNTELIQWAVIGDEAEPHRLSIAVALDAGADPNAEGRVQMPDGRVLEVFEIITEDSARADAAEIDAWIDARVGDAFSSSEAWQRLIATGNDEGLLRGADAHARLCKAASIGGAEADLLVARQAACDADDADLDQRRQPNCHGLVEQLEWFLSVNDVMSTVGGGAAITGALVATGVIASGPVIGAVFVGSVVGIILVSNAMESFVNENRDTVFDVAGAGGERFTGDPGSGQAFSDFFSDGGGTGSGSGGGGGGRSAGSSGDPHIDTFDGKSYGFHGAGEFVLVEATAGAPMSVQVRQEPARGICPSVTFNTAVAAQVGQTRLAFYGDRHNPLFVDGEPTTVPGGILPLPGGGSVELSSSTYLVRWPGGEQMKLKARFGSAPIFDVRIGLPEHRRGQVRGILGNFNGDPSDDIQARSGQILEEPVSWTELYEVFGVSWRVEEGRSLFDYDEGEGPETYLVEGFPARPALLEILPAEAVEEAEAICAEAGIENEIAFQGCVLDLACTNDHAFTESHTDRQPTAELDLVMPIFLDGWVQQGRPSNGNWVVDEDGRSVTQSVNGDPTFFVSTNAYHNTTIRGTFRVDRNSDDDFIGFVFGYKAPLEENEDDMNTFDTFLLSWKAHDQSHGGYLGPEGFALSHVLGEVPSSDYARVFWGQEDTEVHRVIATRYAPGIGWRHVTSYPFELTYTPQEIVIVIGGEEIFRVAAAQSPAPFEPGRFGFYNYSQANVVYGDFQSGAAEADPTASLQGLEVGVQRPGDDFEEFEMEVADPRLCREACLADARCESFTYRRPTFSGVTGYCWLKDGVPDAVSDEGFISGVR